MTDPVDPIRAALVEAMAEASYIRANAISERMGLQRHEETMQWHRAEADAALSVVESWQPRKPCDAQRCRNGRIAVAGVDGEPGSIECDRCGGSGSLPPDPSDAPGALSLFNDGVLLAEVMRRKIPLYPSSWMESWASEEDRSYRLRERKP